MRAIPLSAKRPRRGVGVSRAALEARFGPALADILNSARVVGHDRFATPSVLVACARVADAYASDVSISASYQPLAEAFHAAA